MAMLKKIGRWIYEHRATLMSWGATAGTISGSVLAARAADKAVDRMDEALAKKKQALEAQMTEELYDHDDIQEALDNTELTLMEKVRAGGPAFIPTVLVEAATIGCIHGSNIANKQEISKAKDMLAVAVAGYTAYHESVGAITDRTTEYAAYKRATMINESEKNGEPPWDQKRLFCIQGQDGVFERTMDEVFLAEYEANRIFALRGDLTLNDLYRLLDLPEVHDTMEYDRDGDCNGWDDYLGEVYYGYHWIDFSHPRKTLPDGRMVTEIFLPFGPHSMDEEIVEREIDQQACRGVEKDMQMLHG